MMLTEDLRVFLKRLERFARVFASRAVAKDGEVARFGDGTSIRDLKTAICGFHSDMLCSLVHAVVRSAEKRRGGSDEVLDWDELYSEAVARLLLASTPEAACRILQSKAQHAALLQGHGVDVPAIYFGEQRHSNLHAFASSATARDVDVGGGARPSLSMLMTYAPLFLGAAHQVQQVGTWSKVSLTVLHDLDSERDLQHAVDQFFETAERGSVLLVQCDPRAASLRRIAHAQHVCEKAADMFAASHPEFFADATAVSAESVIAGAAGGPTASSADVEKDASPAPDKSGGVEMADSGKGEPPAELEVMQKDKDEMAQQAAKDAEKGRTRRNGLDIVFLVHLQRGSDAMFNINFDHRCVRT